MKILSRGMLAALTLGLFGTTGLPAAELSVGDVAPEFSLPGSDGKTHSSADLEGKVVVIAWYPKAFTGG